VLINNISTRVNPLSNARNHWQYFKR